MSKWTRNLALMLAMGSFSITALSVASLDSQAQDKKTKSTKPGKILIKEGKDGKFRFNLYDGNEKFIAMSGPSGFATKEDALKAVETAKLILNEGKVEYGKATMEEDEPKEPKKAPAKKAPAKKDPEKPAA